MWYWGISLLLISASVIKNIHIAFPLTVIYILFVAVSFRRGISGREITTSACAGGKKAFCIVQMLLLVGVNTAAWLSSGCIAALIHYGCALIRGKAFLLMTFLLCAGVSYLMGSALAAASTVGILLYIIGCGGGVPGGMVAGAIISGTYVGDRCSPVSSPLFLLSQVAGISHRDAVRIAGRTGLPPLLLTAIAFGVLSVFYPLEGDLSAMTNLLRDTFRIDLLTLLPAVLLLGLSLLKATMLQCLSVSAAAACLLAIFYQDVQMTSLLVSVLNGFYLPDGHPLYSIVKGGGILPMFQSIYVIFLSCSLSKLLQDGNFVPDPIQTFLDCGTDRVRLNWHGAVFGVLAAAIGCNQAMAVVMTVEMMRPRYEKAGFTAEDLFLDVSFGSSLLATLPPWSLSVSLHLAALQFHGYTYMPFLLFVFISVSYHAIWCVFRTRRSSKSAQTI